MYDEDKSIDVDSSLEMALKAFVSQYKLDLGSVESLYRCEQSPYLHVGLFLGGMLTPFHNSM